MALLNQVQLIGTLANRPELRFTPSGRAVTSFTVNVENEE
jgi:single-stranded DNA-binding protein